MVAALLGIALLIGCIPVPVFRPGGGRPRPEERIGGPSSDKPLRLGRSTREDVHRLLGQPRDTPDTRTDVHAYYSTTVNWIYPLCFASVPSTSPRFVRLEYADDGVLRRYKMFKTPDAAQAIR